ncbi:MAG: hypothetical protein J1E40_07145 [Oscillospiraceae bacterium]|nr:hypothetical protein [Oscillospiraceae bacterium]
MAKMKTGDQEKIRQFKQEIKDIKKDLKDTFAEVEEPKPKEKPVLLWIIIPAALVFLAAAGYLLFRSGII